LTLVVGRVEKGRVAVAADTLVTQNDAPLPVRKWTIKSCVLPGNICVSFSNSPEHAETDFATFAGNYPAGCNFSGVISFFEASSARTGNDYLIAFASPARIVKIADGKRINSIAKTAWIGDQTAYERFRRYEAKQMPHAEHGRAMNAVLFGDELSNSPASDLYSVMRNLVLDHSVPSVGGFVSVISGRETGFRYSVYSDMLFDWPASTTEEYVPDLNDPIALNASGENVVHGIAQVSPGFLDANFVAFYFIGGRKLFLFYGQNNGIPSSCLVLDAVEPGEIQTRLNAAVGTDLKWLLIITSAVPASDMETLETVGKGMRLGFFTHANTFPAPTRR
jgi:hypothetical protein